MPPASHVRCALCDRQACIDPTIGTTTSEQVGMLDAVVAVATAAMTSSGGAVCAPSLASTAPSRWRCSTCSSSRPMAAAARLRRRRWRPAAAGDCSGAISTQWRSQSATPPPHSSTRRARAPGRLDALRGVARPLAEARPWRTKRRCRRRQRWWTRCSSPLSRWPASRTPRGLCRSGWRRCADP